MSAKLIRQAMLAVAFLYNALGTLFAVPTAGVLRGALTLTGLIPTIYEAMDVVARELVGFIPAVQKDAQMTRAAVGQTVRSPVVGAMAAEDLAPAAYAADTPAQTINYFDVSITKARSVPFGVTGEEFQSLSGTEMVGANYGTINRDRIAQALRTLTNEIESDLAANFVNAARAYGTAAQTPFGTAGDLSDLANVRRILDDNGSPQSDFHCVLDSVATANLRGKMANLFRVNESGTDALLRTGSITADLLQGFALHTSGQTKKAVAVGTGASYTTTAAGFAVGTTSIPIITGTGTVLAGDVVTFAGDTNKYVVKTGVSAPGTIVLNEPGLQQAIPASATAMTIVAASTRNMAFQRSAIVLATRAPAMPPGGDDADDVMLVTDPVSGLTFEFCIYKQKRQVRYEVNLAWGTATPNGKYLALLLG